ncbi:MAG TPA: LysR family transcriptional regulator [Thiolinea sp.]|nr:LysR family transcriptional regulator [Thiolinea sp.]
MDWPRKLRIKHLQLFVTLAETGNISETARLQFSTQPGLSKWLKELEGDMGGALFERHARGLTLTPLGGHFLGRARRILNETERMQQSVEAIKAGSTHLINIGTSPASASNFVPMGILHFLRLYPEARVEICENTMDILIQKLEDRVLDLVIGRLDNYRPRVPLLSEVLYEEPLRIIARPGHPLAGKKVSWDELYRYDWIVWPEGTPIRSKFDSAIIAAGRKPPCYRIESSSQMGNLYLLQNSDMLSAGSDRIVQDHVRQNLLTLLDFRINRVEGPVGMCWRDDPYIDPVILKVLDCFREMAANEPVLPVL